MPATQCRTSIRIHNRASIRGKAHAPGNRPSMGICAHRTNARADVELLRQGPLPGSGDISAGWAPRIMTTSTTARPAPPTSCHDACYADPRAEIPGPRVYTHLRTNHGQQNPRAVRPGARRTAETGREGAPAPRRRWPGRSSLPPPSTTTNARPVGLPKRGRGVCTVMESVDLCRQLGQLLDA